MDGYNSEPLIIFGGSGRVLAENLYRAMSGAGGGSHINKSFQLGEMNLGKFPCGEPDVQIKTNVRERNVYVIQSCKDRVYDAFELLVINDAARRASANKIIDVISNYPFARQDRKARGRQPITAKTYAKLLEVTGADRVCTIDLHAGQIQGFFEIPCDNLEPTMLFAHDIKEKYGGFDNIVFVAPDEGAWKRIGDVVKKSGVGDVPVAMINKRRISGSDVEVYGVVGEEYISGRNALFMDDEIDTAGSLSGGTEALMNLKNPPKSVAFYATHGTFSDPADERLVECTEKYGIEVVVTDTIPQEEKSWKRVIAVAPLLAHAMDRVERADSVSALFDPDKFESILYPTD